MNWFGLNPSTSRSALWRISNIREDTIEGSTHSFHLVFITHVRGQKDVHGWAPAQKTWPRKAVAINGAFVLWESSHCFQSNPTASKNVLLCSLICSLVGFKVTLLSLWEFNDVTPQANLQLFPYERLQREPQQHLHTPSLPVCTHNNRQRWNSAAADLHGPRTVRGGFELAPIDRRNSLCCLRLNPASFLESIHPPPPSHPEREKANKVCTELLSVTLLWFLFFAQK